MCGATGVLPLRYCWGVASGEHPQPTSGGTLKVLQQAQQAEGVQPPGHRHQEPAAQGKQMGEPVWPMGERPVCRLNS